MERRCIQVVLSSLLADPNISYFARPILSFEYKEDDFVVYTKPAKDFIIKYNSRFNKQYDSTEKEVGYLKASILSSVLVYLLNYKSRGQGKNKALWKVCVILEINEILLGLKVNGLALPNEAITASVLKLPNGLLAEQYYDLLSPLLENCNTEDNVFSTCIEAEKGSKKQKSDVNKVLNTGLAEQRKHEISKRYDENNNMTVADLDEIFSDDSSEDVAIAGLSATFLHSISTSDNYGSIPAGLRIFAKALFKSEVDWKRELLAFIRHIHARNMANNKRSYSKLSRREIPGIILPGRIGNITKFGFLFDVSGSMSSSQISKSLTEMLGCLKQIRARALVWSFDTELSFIKEIKSNLDVNAVMNKGITFVGGGGTDVVNCLEKLYNDPEIDKEEINAFVVFTDAQTYWPLTEPFWWSKYPTIVVVLSNSTPPRWVKYVRVKGKE